jgi:hypothetical protein
MQYYTCVLSYWFKNQKHPTTLKTKPCHIEGSAATRYPLKTTLSYRRRHDWDIPWKPHHPVISKEERLRYPLNTTVISKEVRLRYPPNTTVISKKERLRYPLKTWSFLRRFLPLVEMTTRCFGDFSSLPTVVSLEMTTRCYI